MNLRSSETVSTRTKLEFLSRPQTYAGQSKPVQIIETHFAWIFLTERHAYKMKKPTRQDVMDYRSLAQRARGCRNELRLNRRLAPTVYLEVVPLGCERDGSLVLGRGARTVDWIVKMRRLPATRMLEWSIANGSVSARDRRALIAMLAQFYARALQRPMSPAEYVQHLRSRILENLRALQARGLGIKAIGVTEAVQMQRRYLDCNVELISSRASRLIEGHGDLRPEHVYLGSRFDAPCVIDCLEFDARLRRLDPAEEVAFLALECRRLGAESIARDLVRGIQLAIADPIPESLTHFYMSHRALTRAKVAAWHLRDPHLPRRVRHWRQRANAYIENAMHFAELALRGGESKLVFVSGRPKMTPAGLLQRPCVEQSAR